MSLYDKLKTGIIGGGGLAEGKIFSLKPIDGSGDFFFSRASDGTRRNSAGVIVTEPTNMPRADYKFGRTCPAILSERLSQNLVTWSEDFSQWSSQFVSVSKKEGVMSLGTPIYEMEGTSTSVNRIYQSNSMILGEYYSVKIVCKSGDSKTIGLNGFEGSNFFCNEGYNFETDSFYSNTLDLQNHEREFLDDGWIELRFQNIKSKTSQFAIYQGRGTTDQVSDGDIGLKTFFSIAQLEQLSYSTSYIKTAGSVSIPRQPDVINQYVNSNNINSPKGTIFLRMASITTDDEQRAISFNDDGSNEIRVRYYNQGIGVRMIVDGVNVASFSTQQLDQTPFRNIAFNWDETSCSFWVDGEQIGSAILTESYPADTLDRADITGDNPFRGWLEELSVYDNNEIDMEDLTDYNTFEIMANNLNYTVQ